MNEKRKLYYKLKPIPKAMFEELKVYYIVGVQEQNINKYEPKIFWIIPDIPSKTKMIRLDSELSDKCKDVFGYWPEGAQKENKDLYLENPIAILYYAHSPYCQDWYVFVDTNDNNIPDQIFMAGFFGGYGTKDKKVHFSIEAPIFIEHYPNIYELKINREINLPVTKRLVEVAHYALTPPEQFEKEAVEKLEKEYGIKVIEIVKSDVDLWKEERQFEFLPPMFVEEKKPETPSPTQNMPSSEGLGVPTIKNKETPGFEIIDVLGAISILYFLRRWGG